MDILVKNKRIVAIAEHITFGIFDELIEKWKLEDADGNLLHYLVVNDVELIKNVTLPSDYVTGKYFFENGEFVLNEEWKEYKSPEQRIEELEEQVAIHEENDAELLYQICLLQLGITEDDMM